MIRATQICKSLISNFYCSYLTNECVRRYRIKKRIHQIPFFNSELFPERLSSSNSVLCVYKVKMHLKEAKLLDDINVHTLPYEEARIAQSV